MLLNILIICLATFNNAILCLCKEIFDCAFVIGASIMVKPVVYFAELERDATHVKIGVLNVSIASVDHLTIMKTGTWRSKDVMDIEELRKIQAEKSK